MLDSDVASLYKVPSKRINEAVKNNIERFPENFCFQLTLEEYNSLRSKISTLDVKRGKFRKYLPYVFTEQGIAMLSGIIRNPIAVKVSIAIMNAFVLMRKIISKDLLEQKYFKNMLLEHDEKIKLLENSFLEFKNKDQTNIIFFEGQIYDAYSKLVDIMREAKRELIIVDGYADKVVLDMIREIKVPVYLITKKNKVLKELDIRKYREQYDNLEIIYSDSFHDRYLVLDEKEVYHCGTSLNYAGKRTFSINKLEEEEIKNVLITKINEIRGLSKIDKNENR